MKPENGRGSVQERFDMRRQDGACYDSNNCSPAVMERNNHVTHGSCLNSA